MTYTEEQIRSIVDENIELLKQVGKLTDQLSRSEIDRETAERKYNELCERCMSFYVTERDITTDTLFVQVTAPRFMSQDDFNQGISQHLLSACNAERERSIFQDRETVRYKRAK